ncbi:MAG: hypothetical protein U0M31_09465 [Oscillospiraceae bacterium]|nr:hypothetical protein [Oscillospiraceae bacterium]
MFWVMIMKKIVSAALALCLILSACGEAAPAETQEPSEEVGSVVKVACVCAQPSVFGPTSLNGYEYKITHYDYGEHERYIADLTAGDAPDLVLFRTTPFVEYPDLDVNNEYYDDLYEYIDADDTLSRDSFLPNLLEAMSRDGELKFLCRQVTIATFVARRSAVGDGYGLLPSDYERILAENERYLSLFDTFVTKSSLLDSVCIISESAFTDRENASCDFDNDYFRSLLEFCNSSPYDEFIDGQSVSIGFENALLTPERISSVVRFNVMPGVYGDDPVFVGFPDGDMGCSYYICGLGYAIPAQSSNKDGAWAYIKHMLSVEAQRYVTAGLPVILKAFELALEDGDVSEDMQRKALELLERTKYAESVQDSGLKEIITDSCRNYFDGTATLDDTVDIIQSRASVYMSEQYG